LWALTDGGEWKIELPWTTLMQQTISGKWTKIEQPVFVELPFSVTVVTLSSTSVLKEVAFLPCSISDPLSGYPFDHLFCVFVIPNFVLTCFPTVQLQWHALLTNYPLEYH
jgi:hypothetical protein